MKKIILLIAMITAFTACSSLSNVGNKSLLGGANSITKGMSLASKVRVTVPSGMGDITVNGTIRLRAGEMIQLSLLMPILNSEIGRLEFTPQGITFVNRMEKQFARYDYEELNQKFAISTSYGKIENTIIAAATTATANKFLTGQDLGIPKIKGSKIELYDISFNDISLNPFEPNTKYSEIGIESIENILNILK